MKPLLPLPIACLLLYSICISERTAAQESNSSRTPTNLPMLEVLHEEVLDTVSLERPVHFTTPQATDTVVQAGTYRVEPEEPTGMKLVALKNSAPIVVDALSIHHKTDIAEPIAFYVRDDDKFPHVVLLMPGGKGLEAVGSYDASRVRGIGGLRLTPVQIQKALQEKLQRKAK